MPIWLPVTASASIATADKVAPKETSNNRKSIIIKDGTKEEKVTALLKYLQTEKVLDDKNPLAKQGGKIADAYKVCSIGLGLSAQKDLPIIQSLAESIGAEVGCSRPFAEDRQWLPLNRFVGMSGQKFKGSLYVAIGISGSVQHLAGIRDAKIIVAINTDERAPIFANADYGIVGDLYEIVPLLTQALKQLKR